MANILSLSAYFLLFAAPFLVGLLTGVNQAFGSKKKSYAL